MDIGTAIAFLSSFWLLIGMIPLQRKAMAAAVRTRQHRARR
jgi:hypothetical protein